jgi:hypothetical protein
MRLSGMAKRSIEWLPPIQSRHHKNDRRLKSFHLQFQQPAAVLYLRLTLSTRRVPAPAW